MKYETGDMEKEYEALIWKWQSHQHPSVTDLVEPGCSPGF